MSLHSYTAQTVARRKGSKCYLFSPYLFQVGFTSAPGQGGILAQREFDRRFSPHFVSIFQLVIEIALQQLCNPAQGLFASLWCVWFALQSPKSGVATWIAINPYQFSRRVSQKKQRVLSQLRL